MKRLILLLLPVLLVSMAVGIILYKDQGSAEGIGVDTGNAAGNAYGVPGDIYYTQPVESVVFSHQTHAVELGFKCGTCHSAIFQMKAQAVESKPDFNMKGLASGKYCGSCHNSGNRAAFPSDDQCARCHRGVKGLEEAGESGASPESSSVDQYENSVQDQYQRGG